MAAQPCWAFRSAGGLIHVKRKEKPKKNQPKSNSNPGMFLV